MSRCEKCLENNWRFEYIEEWIRATCQYCGHEVEFPSRRKKKIDSGIQIGSVLTVEFQTINGKVCRKENDGQFYPVEFVTVKKGWQIKSIKLQKELF